MKKRTVFPYFWHWDKNEKEVTVFRVYCLDKQNKTVVMKINDFTPYCYLELPTEIDGQPFVWDASKAQLLTNSIKNKLRSFSVFVHDRLPWTSSEVVGVFSFFSSFHSLFFGE